MVYGFASNKEGTPRLLQAVIDRIVHGATGPRFIAADWNLRAHEVPQWQELLQAGFKDVQDLASQWWSQKEQFTRKGTSRKDFLFVSAEMAHLLRAVRVCHDVFPDHSQVVADFAVGDLKVACLLWRHPLSVEGRRSTAQLPVDQITSFDRTKPLSERYTEIFQVFEDRLSGERMRSGQAPLAPAQRGRATTFEVTPRKSRPVPPVKGREGEFIPQLTAPRAQHVQWYRQLRRLQAYEQGVRHQRTSYGSIAQRAELWRAIRHATGFVPSFPTWAKQQLSCMQELPSFPVHPPDHDFAAACFENFRDSVRNLEKEVQRCSIRSAKEARAKNPSLIFKDLAKDWAAPVETLVESQQAKVVEVRQDENLLVLDRPMCWWDDAPLLSAEGPLQQVHAAEDAIWCQTENIEVGQVVTQERNWEGLGRLPSICQGVECPLDQA